MWCLELVKPKLKYCDPGKQTPDCNRIIGFSFRDCESSKVFDRRRRLILFDTTVWLGIYKQLHFYLF